MNIEVLADGKPHETEYDLFRVNGGHPCELEQAMAVAHAYLSGEWETLNGTDIVVLRRVRVRQIVQIVEEDEDDG